MAKGLKISLNVEIKNSLIISTFEGILRSGILKVLLKL